MWGTIASMSETLTQKKVTITGTLKKIPIVGGFVSRIFSKPRYGKDGFKHFCEWYGHPSRIGRSWIKAHGKAVIRFMRRQSMTLEQKRYVCKIVPQKSATFTRARKKSLAEALNNIQVVAEKKIQPVEVHKVSASYKPQEVTKSRDVQEVVQAGISKIPIYVLVGIGALFILPQLLRMRGGKE